MVLRTCLHLARHSADRPWRALVGKLMNRGIRMLLSLVDREHCLSAMRILLSGSGLTFVDTLPLDFLLEI